MGILDDFSGHIKRTAQAVNTIDIITEHEFNGKAVVYINRHFYNDVAKMLQNDVITATCNLQILYKPSNQIAKHNALIIDMRDWSNIMLEPKADNIMNLIDKMKHELIDLRCEYIYINKNG